LDWTQSKSEEVKMGRKKTHTIKKRGGALVNQDKKIMKITR
jgi:hypothetical protein